MFVTAQRRQAPTICMLPFPDAKPEGGGDGDGGGGPDFPVARCNRVVSTLAYANLSKASTATCTVTDCDGGTICWPPLLARLREIHRLCWPTDLCD